jgi:peroxiredoxin
VVATIVAQPTEQPTGPAIGEVFPDFTLPDQHGRLVNLTAHRAGGVALVVVFRSASW